MLVGFRLAYLAISFAALATGAARAQTAPATPPAAASDVDPQILEERAAEARLLKTLFGVEAPKARSRACFTRVYDAAHMKAHPYQHIVEIRISAHYDPVERPRKDSDTPRSKWGYAIHSRLRTGKIKTFLDDGACWSRPKSSAILCNAACDSGDNLVIAADGKSAKLGVKEDLVHPEWSGPGVPDNLAAKADDWDFRIYRAKDSLCDFDKP